VIKVKSFVEEATNRRHHAFEGFHDFGTFAFLIVLEAAGNDDDTHEHETQIQIVGRRILKSEVIDGVSDIAEDRTNPQEHRKATEEILAELDPFRSCLWRSQR
jgi:hypothetical protein